MKHKPGSIFWSKNMVKTKVLHDKQPRSQSGIVRMILGPSRSCTNYFLYVYSHSQGSRGRLDGAHGIDAMVPIPNPYSDTEAYHGFMVGSLQFVTPRWESSVALGCQCTGPLPNPMAGNKGHQASD